jgi:hypothetical protein
MVDGGGDSVEMGDACVMRNEKNCQFLNIVNKKIGPP